MCDSSKTHVWVPALPSLALRRLVSRPGFCSPPLLCVMIGTLQRRHVFLSVLRVVLNEDGEVSVEWHEAEFSELSQLL